MHILGIVLSILAFIFWLGLNEAFRKQTGVNLPSRNATRRIRKNARNKGLSEAEALSEWVDNKQARFPKSHPYYQPKNTPPALRITYASPEPLPAVVSVAGSVHRDSDQPKSSGKGWALVAVVSVAAFVIFEVAQNRTAMQDPSTPSSVTAAPSSDKDGSETPRADQSTAPQFRSAPLAVVWVKLSRNANLRDGPGLNFATLKTLNRGTILKAFDHQGAWVNVGSETPFGWIHENLLQTMQVVDGAK